jgi:hypothetical protein
VDEIRRRCIYREKRSSNIEQESIQKTASPDFISGKRKSEADKEGRKRSLVKQTGLIYRPPKLETDIVGWWTRSDSYSIC